jgi:hypothetical protein
MSNLTAKGAKNYAKSAKFFLKLCGLCVFNLAFFAVKKTFLIPTSEFGPEAPGLKSWNLFKIRGLKIY